MSSLPLLTETGSVYLGFRFASRVEASAALEADQHLIEPLYELRANLREAVSVKSRA